MIRKVGALALVGLLAVSASVFASAESMDFGFRGGYERVAAADSGNVMGGAFLRWNWHSYLFTEIAALYHTEEVTQGSKTLDLEMIPIQLSLQLYFLRRDMAFSPYLMAGVGTYVLRTVDKETDSSDSEWDFGFHLGFGGDYALSDRIFVEGDFRYIWLHADIGGKTLAETLSDFNSWMGTVGIGFRM